MYSVKQQEKVTILEHLQVQMSLPDPGIVQPLILATSFCSFTAAPCPDFHQFFPIVKMANNSCFGVKTLYPTY